MTNPLTRLIGQAEINLADLSRRAAASVADPILAKGQEVVADVAGKAASAARTIVIKAVLGLIAGVMIIAALLYAVAALYWALLPTLGPVDTRLVMAGVFAGLALIALLAMVFWPKGAPPVPQRVKADAAAAMAEARRVMAQTEAVVAAPNAAPDPAQPTPETPPVDLKTGVEALASILGEAGYRREQAGLKTGLALASQLKPMQIVSLALIGGYIAGLRYMARRR